MKDNKENTIHTGMRPEKIAEELGPLVDFQSEGMPLDQIRHLIQTSLVPHFKQYDHPYFLSLFNAYAEEGAAAGAQVALRYNQGVTNWQVSPGGAMLEELCCRALCRIFSLPPSSDATFMYSGTYANQEALYLALHRHAEKNGFDLGSKGLSGYENPERLKIFASEDAHFSIRHAVRMLGLGEENLILIRADDRRRLDFTDFLNRMGTLPSSSDIICVIATAGTTSTGAVDPIKLLSRNCAENDIWFHIDGAYGFIYSILPEKKELFQGYAEADSITWDPHKQMGVPIPNSLLFVKNREDFGRMAIHSGYFNREDDPFPNPGLKSPPSTRPLSALPLVCSIRHLGIQRLVDRLRTPLSAVKTAAERLSGMDDIEVVCPPDTGILCFRITTYHSTDSRLDDLQQYIFQTLTDEGEKSVSLTTISGRKALRLVTVSPAVQSEHLLETVKACRDIAVKAADR